MTAYRLHFETATTRAIELARKRKLGQPKFFSSVFSMRVKPNNIRTQAELGGGTLYDLGVYCINAARNLFGAEPVEVFAYSVNTARNRMPEIDETTAAVLRFEADQLATFVTSFNSADTGDYSIVGEKGSLKVDPGYEYAEGLSYELTIDGKTTRKTTAKRDQFAPELVHFSDCIRRNRDPEPSGLEGLQDVRVVEALYESARRGQPVRLPKYREAARPTRNQEMRRPAIRKPQLVKAESASGD
jgi:glucose-fructose oxidoreductase